MAKSILKEICIMLLLCVAIVLVLGVIFYDSIPSNKVVPNKIEAYTTPENVQTKIAEEVSGLNKVEVSYEITDNDLSLYKAQSVYETMKQDDPFSDSVTTNSSANTNGTSENNNSSGNTNGITDPNSTGTYYNSTGK